MNIAIVYDSRSGHTKKLADHIAEGTNSTSNTHTAIINVKELSDASWETLHQAHAIIFGSPTFMGDVSGPFKLFMDQSSSFWIPQKWADKIAAGFTVGTSESGDKLHTLISMSLFAAVHGMVWVGQNLLDSRYTNNDTLINKNGSHIGLMAQSDRDKLKLIPETDAITARLFGKRVAEAAIRWHQASV